MIRKIQQFDSELIILSYFKDIMKCKEILSKQIIQKYINCHIIFFINFNGRFNSNYEKFQESLFFITRGRGFHYYIFII